MYCLVHSFELGLNWGPVCKCFKNWGGGAGPQAPMDGTPMCAPRLAAAQFCYQLHQRQLHKSSVHFEPPLSAQQELDANPDPANVEPDASEQLSLPVAQPPTSYNVAVNANEPEEAETLTPPTTSWACRRLVLSSL